MELVIGAIITIALGVLLLRARVPLLGGLLAAALVLALLLATSQAISLMLSLVAILLLSLLLLAGAGAVAYLFFRLPFRREASHGAWLPGPYAYWGRMPQEEAPTLPASHLSALPPYGLPYLGYPAIPLEEEDDEDLVPPWWA